MARLLLVILVLGFAWRALAQPRVEFEKTVHDFGEILEVDGIAEYTFLFRNVGNAPLRIAGVRASCGCTTPAWTTEEVPPGESGYITAQYNTANRPGPFNKSLQVTTNAEPANLTLYIRGQVVPKPRTVEDDLPAKYGALRLKHRSLNLGKITTEKPMVKTFDVYNDSDSVLVFLPEGTEVPAHLGVAFLPDSLAPKSYGQLVVTYNPEAKQALGYHSDRVVIRTTGAEPEKVLYVIATIEEYFPPMSEEELAQAPRLVIQKKMHDFGKILSGSSAEAVFVLRNDGQQPLNIRNTMPNCDCTVAELEKQDIAPGETISMKVIFNTAGRKGRQYKNVTIFSNDPQAPTQMVTIKADLGG